MISVVIPTIPGREHLLEQTISRFEQSADVEIIVAANHPSCGQAWNAGAEQATGEFLLLGADDLTPDDGWAEAAMNAAARGVYPAPWIVRRDGSTECCGTLGSGLLLTDQARDGLPVCSSPVPFMRREMWEHVGPSLPGHYYSDDWLGYRARLAGLSVQVRRGYRFTHLDGQAGHARLVARSGSDRARFAEEVSKL